MYPCFNNVDNYGTSIWGLSDPENKLLPLFVSSTNIKEPNVRDVPPEDPVDMDLSIHIDGLTLGKKYSIFKYDMTMWPKDSQYTKTGASAYASFVATETSYVLPEQLLGDGSTMSNGNAYFACVLASVSDVDDHLIVLE